MLANKLKINDSKTEYILIGTTKMLSKVQNYDLKVEDTIHAEHVVWNLAGCSVRWKPELVRTYYKSLQDRIISSVQPVAY